MFRRLVIANRGEIACRIARTARALGIEVLALYSAADAGARHVRLADEAWPIGAAPAEQSYLNVAAILAAARAARADAIHPGYGFLAENAQFAADCAAAGLVFVGPSPQAIAAMGDKAAAKERMARAGVAVLPGYQGADQALATLERRGAELGFPLIIKPSAGGGGKGMHIVRAQSELSDALDAARRLAVSAFGDGHLLLERYLASARHVEVQLLSDGHGRVLHLSDRDCSVQRRHQKLIEEAPAPQISPATRARLADAACTVARAIDYVGAGTVEFLLEGTDCYFMEMNTRLQVEHGVTEAISAVDLVEWQLRIAAGEPLTLEQSQLAPRGHAVEARICAEDPVRDFLPGAGTLALAQWPEPLTGVRVDRGFDSGDVVPPHYDSLLGKVIAHGRTRSEAIARLRSALAATRIAGVPTNTQWLAAALDTAALRAGPVSTGFVAEHGEALAGTSESLELAPFAAAAYVFARASVGGAERTPWDAVDGFRLGGSAATEVRLVRNDKRLIARCLWCHPQSLEVSIAGREGVTTALELEAPGLLGHPLTLRPRSGGGYGHVLVRGQAIDAWRDGLHEIYRAEALDDCASASTVASGGLTTLLPGVVVGVRVAAGEHVEPGQALLIVEAMKMEHTIRAPHAGTIGAVHVRAGDRVRENQTLITLAAPEIEPSGSPPNAERG